jgi:hypothetical protein
VKGLLANKLAKIASATMAYAYEIGNHQLEKEVDYSESILERLNDELFMETSGVIYDKSFALKTELADYGLGDADFTKASSLRDSFKLLCPNVSEVRDKHKADNALLNEKIGEVRELLRKKIDRLTRVLAEANPDFYALYKNARAIDDYHGKSKKQMIEEGIGSISGSINSLFDGSLLEGVKVEILNTEFSDNTDEDGYYYFEDVPAGTYSLRITFDTYKELIIEDVVLNAGDELMVDGALDADVDTV